MRTFNASIGHSRKKVKPETSASHSGSRFNTLSLDGKLDNIVTSIHKLSTKMSELIYFTLSQHSVGYEVYLPTNSIGSDSKEARGEYVVIP